MLKLRITAVANEAEDILSYELRPAGAAVPLPARAAGAHLDLHLPGGLRRSYSIWNPPIERDRYLIAVLRDRFGRGGSALVHRTFAAGSLIDASEPRNHFALDESAPHSVLIAGGIGITPILSMMHRLHELGASWSLHYAVRSRAAGAFLPRVQSPPFAARTRLWVDQEAAGRRLPVDRIVADAPAGAHFYCCGPAGMLAAFRAATAGLDAARVHQEAFTADAGPAAGSAFDVVLERSGRRLHVPADRTILQVVVDAGIAAEHSCQQGVCGACETRVLAGTPDHRDSLLSAEERAANRTMMICCSRSKDGGELRLDL
ncbi:MAG TPA: PDR/VanB family oxidoreductase [Burkholderiaceae bacterium]|nr:PDR/VanB family oxidoreductase [Burkholderiaceae bacterium]